MGKLAARPTRTRARTTCKARPAKKPKGLMRFYGAIPGMEKWALDELKRMRNEW